MHFIKPEFLYRSDKRLTTHLYPQSRYSFPRPPIIYTFMTHFDLILQYALVFANKFFPSCVPNKTAYALLLIPKYASRMLTPSLSP